MSVKKQNPSLRELYSFHEESPREFLDQTDVESCFCYVNIFEISQSLYRIGRDSNVQKYFSAIKLFQFCNLTQQRYSLPDELNVSNIELSFLVDSLRGFLKTFD